MFSSPNLPGVRLTATMRRLILLASITIGISIQLTVPEGVTVSDIAVSARTGSGATLALPHSATVTAPPTSATAVSAPTNSTVTSVPRSATASAPTNTTAH